MARIDLHRTEVSGQRAQVFPNGLWADCDMDALLTPPKPPLIVRVKFRNGAVREVLGDDAKCEALFNTDEERLIDYVQTLDPHSLEFAIWHHDDDSRWEGIEL